MPSSSPPPSSSSSPPPSFSNKPSSSSSPSFQPYCYEIKWGNHGPGQRRIVKPVTAFPAKHSLVQTYGCFNTGDPIPTEGVECGPHSSSTSGEAWYSLDNPVGSSSNTGYESQNKVTIYFLLDNAGRGSFVINYDKPYQNGTNSGGSAIMNITSTGLMGNSDVSAQLRDDGYPRMEFGEWNVTDGSMIDASWSWGSCCTDGGVLGYLPRTDEFCLNLVWSKLRGIDGIRVGSFDETTNEISFAEVDSSFAFGRGIEACFYACSDVPPEPSMRPSVPPSALPSQSPSVSVMPSSLPSSQPSFQPYCYEIKWGDRGAGQRRIVNPVTAFTANHSLVETYGCFDVGDPIPTGGVKCGPHRSDSSGEAWYARGAPMGASSNTGYESLNKLSIYFVLDDAGKGSFVISYDKPHNITGILGGRAKMDITSTGLRGNEQVWSQLRDDPDEFGDWNIRTGSIMGAEWEWSSCCTDGGVLGYLPRSEFCLNLVWSTLRGIDGIQVGSFDRVTNEMSFVEVDASYAFGSGIEACFYACSDVPPETAITEPPSVSPSVSLVPSSSQPTLQPYCYEIKWGQYPGQSQFVQPVTAFPANHSLVETYGCYEAGDPIPTNGVWCGPHKSSTSGEAWYSLGKPVSSSSNTGFETQNKVSIYFILDDAGKGSFVINYDKSTTESRSGGHAVMDITSTDLHGNSEIAVHLRDDPNEFGEWNVRTGSIIGARWHWSSCCTDGGVIGYLPKKDYCLNLLWSELSGIDGIQVGSFDRSTNELSFVDVDVSNAFSGIQACAYACSEVR